MDQRPEKFDPRTLELETENDRLRRQAAELLAERDSIFLSTSWQITAPLRRLLSRFPKAHAGLKKVIEVAKNSRMSGYPTPSSLYKTSYPDSSPSETAREHPLSSVPEKKDADVESRVRGPSGHWIYVDPTDERGRRLISAGGSLSWQTLVVWQLLLAETKWTHIFDVGANYGEMIVNVTLPQGAEIIAVEPHPVVQRLLARTLSEAAIPAEIVYAAFSDTEQPQRFAVHGSWSGFSRLARPDDPAGIEVSTTTIGRSLRHAQIPMSEISALVKIDAEGDEAKVLRGGIDEFNSLRRFTALVEVAHVSQCDLHWMEQSFDIEMLRLGNRAELIAIPQGKLLTMFNDQAFYHHDIVLRRKG